MRRPENEGSPGFRPDEIGAMRRPDNGVSPFFLGFCRPYLGQVVDGSFEKGVFAIISDGFHEERVTSWPKLGLPFPTNPSRVLTISVYLAIDDAAFHREQRKEVGTCYLPMWRLPELASAPPTANGDPPELWLGLEAPSRLLRRRRVESGGNVEEEEARLQAELFSCFERSQEQVLTDPTRPRICVIVQARHDIGAAMSGLMRWTVGSAHPSAPPEHGAGGFWQPPWGPTPHTLLHAGHFRHPSAGSITTSLTLSAPSSPHGQELGRPHSGPALPPSAGCGSAFMIGSLASSVTSVPSFGTRADAPMEAPPPQASACASRAVTSASSGSAGLRGDSYSGGGVLDAEEPPAGDAFWKARWEEERRSLEERQSLYQGHMRTANKGRDYQAALLDRLSLFVASRVVVFRASECFDLWRRAVTEEKRLRQFEQICQESDRLRHDNDLEIAGLADELETAALSLKEKERQLFIQKQNWLQRLPAIQFSLRSAASKLLLSHILAIWRARVSWFASVSYLVIGRAFASMSALIQEAFQTWVSWVGEGHLEAIQDRVRAMRRSLAQDIRRECASRVLLSIMFCESGEMGNVKTHKLSSLFIFWVRVAAANLSKRVRMEFLLRSRLLVGVDAASLRCLLLAWRGAIRRTEHALKVQGTRARLSLKICRKRWTNVFETALASTEGALVHKSIVGWFLYAANSRAEKALEQIFNEHEDTQVSARLVHNGFVEIQSRLDMEFRCHEDRCEALGKDVASSEAELERRTLESDAMKVSHGKLDQHHAEFEQRAAQLVEELQEVREVGLLEAAQAEALRRDCEEAEVVHAAEEVTFQEESAVAQSEYERLEQEVSRARKLRQRDVNLAKQHLRAQVQRQIGSEEKLRRSILEDSEKRTQQLAQSEGRVEKLAAQVSEQRRLLEEAQAGKPEDDARTSELAALAEEVLEAERSLQPAQEAARTKQERLAILRKEALKLNAREASLDQKLRRLRGER